MKSFKVGIWEEQGGYVWINAKTEEEAREKAQLGLEEDGTNYFKDFDLTHRGIDVLDSEENK